MKEIQDLIKKIEIEINKTPTGDLRNLLCDAIIALHQSLNVTSFNAVLFNEGDCITDGEFVAKLETKPTVTADIIWLHNNTYDRNVDISKFFLM